MKEEETYSIPISHNILFSLGYRFTLPPDYSRETIVYDENGNQVGTITYVRGIPIFRTKRKEIINAIIRERSLQLRRLVEEERRRKEKEREHRKERDLKEILIDIEDELHEIKELLK